MLEFCFGIAAVQDPRCGGFPFRLMPADEVQAFTAVVLDPLSVLACAIGGLRHLHQLAAHHILRDFVCDPKADISFATCQIGHVVGEVQVEVNVRIFFRKQHQIIHNGRHGQTVGHGHVDGALGLGIAPDDDAGGGGHFIFHTLGVGQQSFAQFRQHQSGLGAVEQAAADTLFQHLQPAGQSCVVDADKRCTAADGAAAGHSKKILQIIPVQ